MKERFKIRCAQNDIIFYDTVDGEEAFTHNGYRFFVRRDWDDEWAVSDVRFGAMISKSPFYDDAVKTAKEKIEKNFAKYLQKIKAPPRPRWRYNRIDEWV